MSTVGGFIAERTQLISDLHFFQLARLCLAVFWNRARRVTPHQDLFSNRNDYSLRLARQRTTGNCNLLSRRIDGRNDPANTTTTPLSALLFLLLCQIGFRHNYELRGGRCLLIG